jgi:hypothetical protein
MKGIWVVPNDDGDERSLASNPPARFAITCLEGNFMNLLRMASETKSVCVGSIYVEGAQTTIKSAGDCYP